MYFGTNFGIFPGDDPSARDLISSSSGISASYAGTCSIIEAAGLIEGPRCATFFSSSLMRRFSISRSTFCIDNSIFKVIAESESRSHLWVFIVVMSKRFLASLQRSPLNISAHSSVHGVSFSNRSS